MMSAESDAPDAGPLIALEIARPAEAAEAAAPTAAATPVRVIPPDMLILLGSSCQTAPLVCEFFFCFFNIICGGWKQHSDGCVLGSHKDLFSVRFGDVLG